MENYAMQTMVMGSNLLERQAAQLVVIPPGGEKSSLDVKPDRQRNEPLTNYAREWKPSRHAAGKQTVRRFIFRWIRHKFPRTRAGAAQPAAPALSDRPAGRQF
jgi:hypothetical protein